MGSFHLHFDHGAMMETQAVIDLLIGGSPMAAFAGFLLWNFWQNRRQIEEMNQNQFNLYRELSKEKDEAEDKIRERYARVVADLQARDQALRTSIESRLDRVESKLEGIHDRLQKIEIREIARSNPI